MSAFGNTTRSLFGGNNTANNVPTQPNIFGTNPVGGGGGSATPGSTSGGLFGTNSSGPSNKTAPSSGIFGSTTSTSTPTPAVTATNIFGNTSATTPTSSTTNNMLFGTAGLSLPKSTDQNAATSPKPAASSFFSQPSAPSGTAPAVGGGIFGLAPKPAETVPKPGDVAGGGLFGKPAASTSTPASSLAPPAGGLFGNIGGGLKPPEKKDGASPSATPATLNLFSNTKSEEKKDAPAAAPVTFSLGQPASKDASKLADASGLSTLTGLGASATNSVTAAPIVAVAPPSMLRGKTIEEIVNRWSTELETHVRDFNKFAREVAVWDRALIENGHNLSALYSHILAAEREQNDIDQSLDHIEQQQTELGTTLDAYEKMIQEILGSQGGSLRALDTGPADTERDKNYMLATDLHAHLDDLSSSLTQMIDTVNALSLPSNDPGPGDDPMAQIAQILSSHLESLQWIDGAVREVDSKVSDVEKRLKDSGHNGSITVSKNRGFGLKR